mmetsp:Transcript_18886/g.64315  ORF Transcript_18886/g.64315 Transcript_18886/m.64315 type:complete len:131 (+) Transcript_18886:51-443(+)
MAFVAARSSFAGAKVNRARAAPRRAASKAMVAKAKYGDESVYFDLGDVEATTGSYTMYGVEESKRYPEQQNEFFERAAGSLTRRESMYSFIALTGAASLMIWGAKGSKDAKLPIQNGPQQPPVVGPRGRI